MYFSQGVRLFILDTVIHVIEMKHLTHHGLNTRGTLHSTKNSAENVLTMSCLGPPDVWGF